MDLQKLLSQALGGQSSSASASSVSNEPASASHAGGVLDQIGKAIPGGLAGGAAAGGVMALLLGSKSTRKMAKKVVKYGGTAVLGGLAYKAYKNWDQNKAADAQSVSDSDIVHAAEHLPQQIDGPSSMPIGLVLIAAMVAATKADGAIDGEEHRRLFEAVEKLGLSSAEKATVFDLFNQDFSAQDIAALVHQDEHKAEVYLAAYLAIEVDDARERQFLDDLSLALALPSGFSSYLEQQAKLGVET